MCHCDALAKMEVWRYKDRIRNEYIRRNLQVASIEEESYEFHLKWSQTRSIYTTIPKTVMSSALRVTSSTKLATAGPIKTSN